MSKIMESIRKDVISLIFDEYSVEPEFPWSDAPDACIFRHSDNRKWFAIIMTVKNSSLGINKEGHTDCINVKIIPEDIYDLLEFEGILPAYHMNKKHWITILLDGSVNTKLIAKLLDTSFELTKKKIYRRIIKS